MRPVSILPIFPVALAATLLLTGALLAPAARADTVFIDFETLPGGAPVADPSHITTQYSSLGVTFTQIEDGATVVGPLVTLDYSLGAGTGNGLYNAVNLIDPQTNANEADILRISFASEVDNVTFLTQGYNDHTAFNAYALDGSFLQSITNTTGGLATIAFTVGGIGRIDALQSQDYFVFRIDNLSYNINLAPAAVPEPGAIVTGLVMAGTTGLGLVRGRLRRRK